MVMMGFECFLAAVVQTFANLWTALDGVANGRQIGLACAGVAIRYNLPVCDHFLTKRRVAVVMHALAGVSKANDCLAKRPSK
jgi:hypothetical protein